MSKRQEFVLYLYNQLSECEDEEEAQQLVALIDQEEAQFPTPPQKESLLDEILLKPFRAGA